MPSSAAWIRLGLLALICCTAGVPRPERAWADGALPEPPLFLPLPVAPVPVVPAPVVPAADCLPKDPPPPVLKVKVRVPAFNAPGQPIEYRFCVENCSTSEAHHVLLKNPLPANARFVRADPEPDARQPEVQWQLGTIGGGACREVVLVLQPTDRADVKNCTRVQFEHGLCVTTRQAAYTPGMAVPPGGMPEAGPPGTTPGTGEPPLGSGQVPKITDADLPRLSVAIEGHKRQYVNLGSHYFVTVTNAGKTRATNVLVSCALPAQMKFVRASHKWNFGEGQVAWVLGDLEPGARRTVELVLRAQSEGLHCVRATARADRGVTAEGEVCTQFIGVSALHVEMSDRDDPLVVGGKTSYPVVIRNQGSAAVTDIRVKAFVPAALHLLDVKGPTKFQLGEKTAQGQWVEMAVLGKLDAMASQSYELFVEALQAGETRVHVEVTADQLERGAVIEEESTTLFADEPPPVKIKPLSRTKAGT